MSKLDNLQKGNGFDAYPERINREGRPRKYVSQLKEQGYKLSEVNDAIQALMSMDAEELKAVLDNPKATILELTIAAAMIKSLKNGSLYSMETLLTRVYGKPKEIQQVTTDSKIEVVFVTGKTIL
jgi:poly-beta-hydroxyalkanoate depolymerase